jgi:hypothetical protein
VTGSGLISKYWTKQKRLAKDNHSNLFVLTVVDEEKSFITSTSGGGLEEAAT